MQILSQYETNHTIIILYLTKLLRWCHMKATDFIFSCLHHYSWSPRHGATHEAHSIFQRRSMSNRLLMLIFNTSLMSNKNCWNFDVDSTLNWHQTLKNQCQNCPLLGTQTQTCLQQTHRTSVIYVTSLPNNHSWFFNVN